MKSKPPPPTSADELRTFFDERIPDGWFVGPVEISHDDVEILVVGTLAVPGDQAEDESACRELAGEFREHTRGDRMAVASEAESTFRRKVSWGVRCNDATLLFTHLSVPAMTRLRLAEREVLDTLVSAGVARSRSDALAWCVRLVRRNLDEWLEELQSALQSVDEVRKKGPSA